MCTMGTWGWQPVPFDCVSVAPLRDIPMVLAPHCQCLSSQHLDASEEAGDEVDSQEDGLVLQQRQQVLNKRPLEGIQVDSDANFRHKKKEVFRLPQFDGRVPFEKDVCISFFLMISSAFIILAFVSNIFLCLF